MPKIVGLVAPPSSWSTASPIRGFRSPNPGRLLKVWIMSRGFGRQRNCGRYPDPLFVISFLEQTSVGTLGFGNLPIRRCNSPRSEWATGFGLLKQERKETTTMRARFSVRNVIDGTL